MAFNRTHLDKKPGTDERYTPKWVFDALNVTFDIDVAAPVGGPIHVPCRHFYTLENDGLTMPWEGVVWMNPPYSKPGPWAARFVNHGNGVALLPTSQGKWWLELWFHPQTVFVPMPSIKFETPDGQLGTTAPWRSWLVGIGETAYLALDRFSDVVVRPTPVGVG